MNDEDFRVFARQVAASFQDMAARGEVFESPISPDALWARYLSAFPEGSNPVFRKNTEHDCACCRHFVKRAGVATAIVGGELRTVWDHAAAAALGIYREVAATMRGFLRSSCGVAGLYRVGKNERAFGAADSRSLNKETGQVERWQHLHTGEIPASLRVDSPGEVVGEHRMRAQVFERGLIELKPEAVVEVLSLVEQNALYRGEEHKVAIEAFQKAQCEYLALAGARERSLYVWANAGGQGARFRNTVVGTLVQDLSEGKDLEQAIKSFEAKVAPQNYKRTTALITPRMVSAAMAEIEALGLELALERRLARIEDVSVGDVLWVDGASKPLMKGGLAGALMRHAEAFHRETYEEKGAEAISLDDFVARVLPETTALEVMFKAEHLGNLAVLTAPVHPEPRQLFRWKNDFAWSYAGGVADSIRERVKKAGGKVEGAVLRVSLSWFNYDDLDLHVVEPSGRGMASINNRIFFRNKRGWTGGCLDVDMNAGRGETREAVENIVWSSSPPDGDYQVIVHNFCQREQSDPGFVVEVESGGRLQHFSHNKAVRHYAEAPVATLRVRGGVVAEAVPGLGISCQNVSQERWGLRTEQWAKVRLASLSPNHWGGEAVGNRHVFFFLEGCRCDEPARGVYNEFLHPRLEKHRRVFEVVGEKTKCPPAEGALAGLGFSSTKRDSFVARARQGKRVRLFEVRVGA